MNRTSTARIRRLRESKQQRISSNNNNYSSNNSTSSTITSVQSYDTKHNNNNNAANTTTTTTANSTAPSSNASTPPRNSNKMEMTTRLLHSSSNNSVLSSQDKQLQLIAQLQSELQRLQLEVQNENSVEEEEDEKQMHRKSNSSNEQQYVTKLIKVENEKQELKLSLKQALDQGMIRSGNITALKLEIKEKDGRIKCLEEALLDFESSSYTKTEEMEKIRSHNAEKQIQIECLEKQIDDFRECFSKQMSSCEKAQNLLNLKEKELDDCRKQLLESSSKLNKSIEEVNSEKSELEYKLNVKQTEVDHFMREQAEYKSLLKEKVGLLATLQSKVEILEDRHTSLESKLIEKDAIISEEELKKLALEDRLNKVLEQSQDQQNCNRNELNELKQQLESLKNANNSLQLQITRQRTTAASLEEEKLLLENELASTTSSLSLAQEQVLQAEQNNIELKQSLREAKRKPPPSNDYIDKLKDELRNANEKLQATRIRSHAQNHSLQSSLDVAEGKLESLEEQVAHLKCQLAEKKVEIDSLKNAATTIRSKSPTIFSLNNNNNNMYKKQLILAEEQIKSLEVQLCETQDNLSSANFNREMIECLRMQLEDKDSRLSELNERLQQSESTKIELIDKMMTLQRRSDTLEEKISSTTTANQDNNHQDALKSMNNSFESEKSELIRKCTSLEVKLRDTMEALQSSLLTSDVDKEKLLKMEENIKFKDDSLKRYEEDLLALKMEKESLQERLASALERALQLDDALKLQVSNNSDELSRLKAEKLRVEEKLVDLHNQNKLKESELRLLSTELGTFQRSSLHQKINSTEIEKYKSLYQTTSDELDKATAQITELENQLVVEEKILANVASLEQKLNMKEKELQKAKYIATNALIQVEELGEALEEQEEMRNQLLKEQQENYEHDEHLFSSLIKAKERIRYLESRNNELESLLKYGPVDTDLDEDDGGRNSEDNSNCYDGNNNNNNNDDDDDDEPPRITPKQHQEQMHKKITPNSTVNNNYVNGRVSPQNLPPIPEYDHAAPSISPSYSKDECDWSDCGISEI